MDAPRTRNVAAETPMNVWRLNRLWCSDGEANGPIGPSGVTAVALRECAQRRGLVVDQLAPEVGTDVAAARVDRRRRADVRLGRHREVVRRLRQPDAGRARERAVRPDPDEHRHLGAQLAEDDLVLRLQQAARCVEDDRSCVVVLLRRLLELVTEVVLRHRIDVGVEVDREHARRRCLGW